MIDFLRRPAAQTGVHMLVVILLIAIITWAVYPWGISTYMGIRLPTAFPVTYHYGFEIASWFFLWLLVYFLSARLGFSVVVLMALYLVFLQGNVEKMRLLHAPIMVSDITAIKELALQHDMFFRYMTYLISFAAIVSGLGIWSWRKSTPNRWLQAHQMVFVLLWLLVLMLVLANRYAIGGYLKRHDLFFNKVNPVMSVFQYGSLATLIQSALFVPPYKSMGGYNKQAVARVIERYGLDQGKEIEALPEQPVNLVVILTEAFTDPEEMGWQTTHDVLPTFRQARARHGGRLLSPVLGGRSANAEFELLTGLSLRLAPANSIPYTDLIRHDVPSIARFLSDRGYLTMAIHIATLDFFNYKSAYKHLGFAMYTTLWDRFPKTDPMGLHASREDLAKVLIEAAGYRRPFFIFTFPNYTHGDWRYDTFADSELDVIDPDGLLQGDERQQVKTYINALHYSDKLFQDLIAHFSRTKDRTMIVMLGDHQPFLDGYRQKAWQRAVDKYGKTEIARVNAGYWVPVAIWRNYELEEPPRPFVLSMNFMPSYLIEQMGLKPTGFFRFNQILREKIGVLSWIIRDKSGDYTFQVPPEFLQLVKDYELIQYDVLQGENYFEQLLQTAR